MPIFACIGIRIPADKLFVAKTTPRCGHKMPAGAKFCPACGLGVDFADDKTMVDGFDGKTLHGIPVKRMKDGDYVVGEDFVQLGGCVTLSDVAPGEFRLYLQEEIALKVRRSN